MSKNTEKVKDNLFPDNNLKIREELLSLHALNPFVSYLSSSRSYMYSLHLSQALPIYGAEEKIIQSGLEKQFGENTHSHKAENDFRVIAVIPRYRGISSDSVTKVISYLIIGEDLETGEFDYIEVPYYCINHTEFGFQYKWNEEVIHTLRKDTVIPKNTILADSPNVKSNNGWAFGVNANLALVSLPETTEDGVVVSERLLDKLTYDVYETKNIEFGSESFPLNIYGDEENYKPFPEIGEKINDDSVVAVLRQYDARYSPGLMSKKDVMNYDIIFDKPFYVKGPGSDIETSDGMVESSVVVDMKVYNNPKYKRDVLTGTSDMVDKYVRGLKQYYRDILDVCEDIKKDYYMRYRNNDVKYSNKLHRLIIEAMAIANTDNNKISYSSRNGNLDLYLCSITVKSRVKAGKSSKVSDSYGQVRVSDFI